jgi:predicted nucleic acid-binding protein
MAVVLDAEPVVAYAMDWAGADTVERQFRRIRDGETTGLMNTVNAVEIHCVLAREATRADADAVIDMADDIGVDWVQSGDVLIEASRFKRQYGLSLGDAFALGTASEAGAKLVVGADDDFEPIELTPAEPGTKQFRDDPD